MCLGPPGAAKGLAAEPIPKKIFSIFRIFGAQSLFHQTRRGHPRMVRALSAAIPLAAAPPQTRASRRRRPPHYRSRAINSATRAAFTTDLTQVRLRKLKDQADETCLKYFPDNCLASI